MRARGGIGRVSSLQFQRGDAKWLDTAKTRVKAWGKGQKATIMILTPEEAATTKLWAGIAYNQHFPGNLCSLALLKDTRLRASPPTRVHNPAQIVMIPHTPQLLQALPKHPSCGFHTFLSPSLDEKVSPCKPLILTLWSGWKKDSGGWPTSRGGPKNKAEHQGLCEQRRREIALQSEVQQIKFQH